jgi:hypothetical protein
VEAEEDEMRDSTAPGLLGRPLWGEKLQKPELSRGEASAYPH